jgi:hypothetical protein
MAKVVTVYHTDDGTQYAVEIPANYTVSPHDYWLLENPAGLPHLPPGWRMRVATLRHPTNVNLHRNFPVQYSGGSNFTIGKEYWILGQDGVIVKWKTIGVIHESYQPKKFTKRRRRQ